MPVKPATVPVTTDFTTLALVRTFVCKIEALNTVGASQPVRKQIEVALLSLEEAVHLADTEQREQYVAARAGEEYKPAARSPIDAFIRVIKEAIREYDATWDHLRHAPGADCIRCRVLAAIEGKQR